METQNDPTAQGSAAPGAPAETQSQQPGADARIAELVAEQKALQAQLAQAQQQTNLMYQQLLQNQNAPQRQEPADPFAPLADAFGEEEKDKAGAFAKAMQAVLAPVQQELQSLRAQLHGQAAAGQFAQFGLKPEEAQLAQQTLAWYAERGIRLDPEHAAVLAAHKRLIPFLAGQNAQAQARGAQTQFNAGAGAGQVPPGFAGQMPQQQAPVALPDPTFGASNRDPNFEAAFKKKYPNGLPL